MERFKTHLLAALGLLTLFTALLLFDLRKSASQVLPPLPNFKVPFQIQLDITDGPQSFTVPRGLTLVIETVAVQAYNTSIYGMRTSIQTTVGGNTASYTFPNYSNNLAQDPVLQDSISATRFYASPGSVVTVSNVQQYAARFVSISGYLTRILN